MNRPTVFMLLGILWLIAADAHSDVRSQPRCATDGAVGSAGRQSIGERPSIGSGLPGIAVPALRVTMAAPIEGTLAAILVKQGQHVEAGDTLARMDDSVAQAAVAVAAAVAQRRAQEETARQQVAFYRHLVQRLEDLRSADLGSDYELLEARTQLKQAEAALQRTVEEHHENQQQLALARARLEQHRLRAPFAGQVVRIHVRPGTTLTRDDPILTLVQLDRLEVDLHLPLALYNRMKIGHCYRLAASVPVNCAVTAQLKFVDPMIDAATGTFRAVFAIPNPEHALPAGFSVSFIGPGEAGDLAEPPRGDSHRTGVGASSPKQNKLKVIGTDPPLEGIRS